MRAISRRTIALLVVGFGFLAAIALAISSGFGGEEVTLVLSDVGELAVVGLSAVFVLWVALSFGRREPVRLQWLVIGLGMLAFAIGDAVWTYIEVGQGLEPPYPGLPDVFYLLEYPLIAFAVLRAGLAYRGLVSLRKPAAVAAGVVVVLGAAMWFGLLGPHIVFADIALGEKLLSVLYPAADLVLYLGPALFVALVVRSLGGGRLAWPWWAVVAGVACLALADSGYSWLSTYDLYEAGSVVDYGWSAGHLLIAVGASIVYDLAHPVVVSRPENPEQAVAA